MAWLVPRRGCDVIGKGYNNSPGVYHDSDYYQEAIYHIALSGCVEMFVFYHAWAETPWDVDLDVMAAAVAELDTVLALVGGGASAHNTSCVSHSVESEIAWDDPHVASGASFKVANAKDGEIWRLTFRSQPNPGSASDHPNAVKVLSTDPFRYWPSGMGEWYELEPVVGARCVFSGCVQPNASSDLGVWLVRCHSSINSLIEL